MTLLAAGAFFYRGIPRWDFGLDNPNKAAAILACILIVLLGLSLKSCKTGQTCFANFETDVKDRRLLPLRLALSAQHDESISKPRALFFLHAISA